LIKKAGLVDYATRRRGDGFSGIVVIRPCRVEVINKQFKPIKPEIALAKRIVEAFNDRSGEGILMLDVPTLDARV
jgi:citrate lyase beta subunit